MKKILFRLVILLFVLGAAWGGYAVFKQLPERQQQVATAKVLRGDVIIRAYARGELRAVRSATLTAPNLFGTVQVTRLAPMGSLAHDKDLIVEFDDSERRAQLEETQLEVDQIDEEIKKAQADLEIGTNQDKVDLLKAQYGVRRAELEVQRNELLAAIDAKKNLLNLEEAKRRLKQLESDIKSRREQAEAEIAVLREQRNKSMIDVNREKMRIAQTKLLSPMTGLVAIRQNRGQGFFFPGMQVPDIREGDTLQPGMPVADVLDLSEFEVVARVGELDRANLHEGQDVTFQLDAVPDKHFRGKIKSMSGTASANIFSGDPGKKFDVVFSIDMQQLLKNLGAKPEDIRRIMETAARNSKKAPLPTTAQPMMMMAQGGGPPGAAAGGQPVRIAAQGPPGAVKAAPAAGAKKPADALAKGAPSLPVPRPGPAGPGGTDFASMTSAALSPEFGTEEERARAQLPPPPEEDSQLQVLLRPGLLANIEITVEKIPNAIHIPAQGIFEKDGQPVVWVASGRRFQQRPVKLARRSESIMVIADGLKPGEVVALADPTAKPGDKKGEKKSGAMQGMPGGGASKGGQ
ncbi:MAG TPA: HlyD family efflux transporter periplasmic adaptor subunit [Bryobacteraceae bacterium]|nr:HlyD family efflux transporter periplasmic adaptor subunit [Bryobacteraceae bacterium]